MAKKVLSKLVGSRWAIRREDAELLASSGIDYLKDSEGYWTSRKEDGEINQVNCVTMRDDGFAVIHVDGPLSYRSDFWTAYGDEDTYNSIEAAFEKCLNDSAVMGIIFDINSPGGEVAGVADLANKIFEARGRKPYGIVSRTGGSMCSAAYWIGSACEKVYTAENGTLGSIGVLCSFTKFNKEIVKVETVVSDLSPDKAPDPETNAGLKLLKKELNDIAAVFIGAVAKHRGVSYETVLNDFGRGGVFIGQNAVEANLADGVKSIDEICAEKISNKTNNGVNQMANKIDSVPQASTPEVDVAAMKAKILGEERARISAINAVFEGLAISEEEKLAFVNDENKTVAEAKDFAFDKMKTLLGEKDAEIVGLKEKLTAAEAKNSEVVAASANAEVSAANKRLLEAQNKEAASIQGGASSVASANSMKAIAAAFAAGMKS